MAITPLPAPKNVYIIGAQGTGKTALVNALKAHFDEKPDPISDTNLPKPIIIEEIARQVLEEKVYKNTDLVTSPSRALQLQRVILERQFKAEQAVRAASSTSTWYISDRSGLDGITYATLFVGEKAALELVSTTEWKELETRMRNGIVILCEAGCKFLVEDGTRLMPTSMEEWMKIDATFRDVLARTKIDYIVISKEMEDLGERVRFVEAATRCHMEMENEK